MTTMHQHHDLDGSHGSATTVAPTTFQVPTGPIKCDACKAKIEQQLRRNPNVIGVEVHPHHQMAEVTVRPGAVTPPAVATAGRPLSAAAALPFRRNSANRRTIL